MARPRTLSAVAERLRAGVPRAVAAPEFVDEFLKAATPEERLAMLAEAPPPTGDARDDALLGAIAEYLAKQHRLPAVPSWVGDPERILPEPWFTTESDSPAMKEYLAVMSPAEFRHHNIFTEAQPLRRARAPVTDGDR